MSNCEGASRVLSCELARIADAMSDRDWFDWATLVISTIAAAATVVAVWVAVVTSRKATSVADQANHIAKEAVLNEERRHHETLLRAQERARRLFGRRVKDWFQRLSEFTAQDKQAQQMRWARRTLSADEREFMGGQPLLDDAAANGHEQMEPLFQFLRLAVSNIKVGTTTIEELNRSAETISAISWQLTHAVDAWEADPDEDATLWAEFYRQRETVRAEHPDADDEAYWAEFKKPV